MHQQSIAWRRTRFTTAKVLEIALQEGSDVEDHVLEETGDEDSDIADDNDDDYLPLDEEESESDEDSVSARPILSRSPIESACAGYAVSEAFAGSSEVELHSWT